MTMYCDIMAVTAKRNKAFLNWNGQPSTCICKVILKALNKYFRENKVHFTLHVKENSQTVFPTFLGQSNYT